MRTIVSAVLLLVIFAPTALAGTVTGGRSGAVAYVKFVAAAGEANDVTVAPGTDTANAVVVRDSGAAITSSPGCTPLDAQTVDCPGSRPLATTDISAELGDGNDTATVAGGLQGRLSGGPGDDRLTACQADGGEGDDVLNGCDGFQSRLVGGPGDDVLTGGAQDDHLDGGPGHNVVHGGGGNDSLVDRDPAAADYIDGGAGSDQLVITAAPSVTVDLGAGTARYASGPVSSLLFVENVLSGPGNDILTGDDGPNTLEAGRGEDVVDGRGRDDVIVDRAGGDVIRGGAGNDRILSFDLYRESIDCGDGIDQAAVDKGDATTGCESVQRPAVDLVPPRLRVRSGDVTVPLNCSPERDALGLVTEGFDGCTTQLTLRIRVGRRLLLAGRLSCASFLKCPSSTGVPLNRRARRILAKRSVRGTVAVVRIPKHLALARTESVTIVRGR
jgi:hypothetical protein